MMSLEKSLVEITNFINQEIEKRIEEHIAMMKGIDFTHSSEELTKANKALHMENRKLREELAQYKANPDCENLRQEMIQQIYKLCCENTDYSRRIKKLRAALTQYTFQDPYKRNLGEFIPNAIALGALAQDDKDAGLSEKEQKADTAPPATSGEPTHETYCAGIKCPQCNEAMIRVENKFTAEWWYQCKKCRIDIKKSVEK